MSKTLLAVATRPELLPLNDPNFSWDQFQSFSADFVCKHHGIEECHHYGKVGDKQDGIDLFADLLDETRSSFQCRRVKKFTKAQTEKLIAETTFEADRYVLMLSCEATRDVRDVIAKHPHWDVWDIRDISRKVRDLDTEAARHLIETHFGSAWRKEFLGLSELTPFLPTADFFRPLLNANHLFNHTGQLIGRTTTLDQLERFVASDTQRVAIFAGRGGIGKSKVLQEFGSSLDRDGKQVRFLVEGAPLGAIVDGLPAAECAAIIDDAHKCDEIKTIISLARRKEPTLKLILACRPHAVERLRALLIQSGFDSRELTYIDELKDLSRDETKQLAEQSLTTKFAHLSDDLTALTGDCPLVTVVAGRLLAEQSIDPRLLERHAEFRDVVLTKFFDEVIGQVGDRIDRIAGEKLLRLISAISPFSIANRDLLDSAAEFLAIDVTTLIEYLGILEEAAILVRRGNTLRIVPDVLADHILHRACQTEQGMKTGYAWKIFEHFRAICPSQVLRNLAELDWRISESDGKDSDLLDEVWQSIREAFRDANHSRRLTILDNLSEVAYYQPKRTLQLVEYAMTNPSAVPEDGNLMGRYSFSHNNVLAKLPRLLKAISYALEYLPRCCDLLWLLGQDDDRRLNSHPDHGMRILSDIAEYDFGKPISISNEVVRAVERWLKDPRVHDHLHSPLAVLDPLLVKTGHSDRSDGVAIKLTPFHVSRENTQQVRNGALGLISECAKSTDRKIALKGVRSLGSALYEPIGYLGMTITAEDKEKWAPDQLDIVNRLRAVINGTHDPLIQLKVIDAVRWTARLGSPASVKQAAQDLINFIPKSFELDLTKFLIDSYDKETLFDGDGSDWEKRQRESREVRRVATLEFTKRYADPNTGFKSLTQQLDAIGTSGIEYDPWMLLAVLSETEPLYAAGLCHELLAVPDSRLSYHFANLLHGVRIADRDDSIKIMQSAIEKDQVVLCRSIGAGYVHWGRENNLSDEEFAIVEQLLVHPDETVRHHAIRALAGMGQTRQRWAIDQLVAVDIGDSRHLADAMCESFDRQWGIPADALTDDDLQKLAAKLESTDEIGEYNIGRFFTYAAKRLPAAIVRLILRRIDRYDEIGYSRDYRPLPFEGLPDLAAVAETENHPELLRVRKYSIKTTGSVIFWLPKLFADISSGFGPVSLEVLKEWIDSGDEGKIKGVGRLLSEAPSNFVFTNVDYIEHLLDQSKNVSDECYTHVCTYLSNSANSGVHSRSIGQPSPEDVAVCDQSRAAAATLMVGSPAHKFYEELAKDAEASITRGLLEDEELG